MRKLVLIGLLVSMSTGCGRCWLPLFRGAPCRDNCPLPAAPIADAGCNGCNSTVSAYPSYEGEVYGSGVVGGEIISGGIIGEPYYGGEVYGGSVAPTLSSPSMVPAS